MAAYVSCVTANFFFPYIDSSDLCKPSLLTYSLFSIFKPQESENEISRICICPKRKG